MTPARMAEHIIKHADDKDKVEEMIFDCLVVGRFFDKVPPKEWWEEVASRLENENFHKEAKLVRSVVTPR
jgi:aspartate/glutamate racemase